MAKLNAEEVFALFCVKGWAHEGNKDRAMRKITRKLSEGFEVDWEGARWVKPNASKYWGREINAVTLGDMQP